MSFMSTPTPWDSLLVKIYLFMLLYFVARLLFGNPDYPVWLFANSVFNEYIIYRLFLRNPQWLFKG